VRRASVPRRAVSIRMREDLAEALDETAKELIVSRNRLVEIAVEEYLWRIGDRLAAGGSTAQALGLVR
jgi:metal-responsive CopG/Arc/MetJ family transcriptional regulator